MTKKRPRVGDPAIIDGEPATIGDIVNDDTIVFYDTERQEALKAIETIRRLPKQKQFSAKASFNPPPTGTRTWCTRDQLIWVVYSNVWSCYGRLLPRDDSGNSVRDRAKLHRIMGEPYDPAHEIACHIAHVTQG